jgi:hypothetical protein
MGNLAHASAEPVADERTFIHNRLALEVFVAEKVRESRTRSKELTGFS